MAKPILWRILLTVLFLALLAGASGVSPARADVAPADSIFGLDGIDPQPMEATNIHMQSETVLIEVPPGNTDVYEYYKEEAVIVRVTADFRFWNPDEDLSSLTVGFPLYTTELNHSHLWENPDLEQVMNLKVFVEGEEFATARQQVNDLDWALWTILFPPGYTNVRVTYDMLVTNLPVDIYSNGHRVIFLSYIFHTGAGWAGPIESADLIVRFPYPAEEMFISPTDSYPGYTIDGNDLRWHFNDFEPTQADDFFMVVVSPYTWQMIIESRESKDDCYSHYFDLYSRFLSPYGNREGGVYIENFRDDFDLVRYHFINPRMVLEAEERLLSELQCARTRDEWQSWINELNRFYEHQSGYTLPQEYANRAMTKMYTLPTFENSPTPNRTKTVFPTRVILFTELPTITRTPTRTLTHTSTITRTLIPTATITPTPPPTRGQVILSGSAGLGLVVALLLGALAFLGSRRKKQ